MPAPRCTVLATLCVPEDEASRRSAWCGRNGGLHRVAWPGGEVEFHPSHGDWIRVLGANGFVVEALHELYTLADAANHDYYDIATAQWASRWPVEDLWAAHLAIDPRGPSREARHGSGGAR